MKPGEIWVFITICLVKCYDMPLVALVCMLSLVSGVSLAVRCLLRCERVRGRQ